jgi:hypothetical protein
MLLDAENELAGNSNLLEIGKINYEIRDKEMQANILAVKEW